MFEFLRRLFRSKSRPPTASTRIDPERTPILPEELKKLTFSFPPLRDDTEASCPETRSEVQEYVDCEAAEEGEIRFIRTYNIDGVHYWLWSHSEGDDLVFVYVEVFEGSLLTGMDGANGLTPEQFLVRQFLKNQYGRKE